jgi:hypothetical protein
MNVVVKKKGVRKNKTSHIGVALSSVIAGMKV